MYLANNIDNESRNSSKCKDTICRNTLLITLYLSAIYYVILGKDKNCRLS